MALEYDKDNSSIRLHQQVYIKMILQKYQMEQCVAVATPMTLDKLMKADSSDFPDRHPPPYASLIGSLLYAAISTRIDICYAVSVLTRFMSQPNSIHWQAAKRVLRYLAGQDIPQLSLHYQKKSNYVDGHFHVAAFVDADHASDVEDRKSVSGYIVKVNDCVVSWSCKKQRTVATSSCEAEYVALSSVGKEVMWFRSFLNELGFQQSSPSTLYCDNRAAIQVSAHDSVHEKSKHIDIAIHWVRNAISEGHLYVEWVSTHEQQADILTKALPKDTFQRLRELLMPMGLSTSKEEC
jgi:hypothetical protein